MKKIWKLLLIFSLMFSALAFVACDDEELLDDCPQGDCEEEEEEKEKEKETGDLPWI